MARLESERKGGYYPTPPKEMELILKRVTARENSTVTLLDPCVGEGDALKLAQDFLISKKVNAISYGIELEKTRAEKAKEKIDHVLACGYENARMSHQAFSFLYLNPPYAEIHGDRLERIFFRDLTKPNSYLTEGAVVILNIPQRVLEPLSDLIAQRLRGVRVYRFTDVNFHQFKQVIVYGYRKSARIGRDDILKKQLIDLAYTSPDFIPTLETEDWNEVQYVIPEPQKKVEIFDTTFVQPEDIIRSMNECNLMEQVSLNIFNPSAQRVERKSPVMPLKISHMATAIAAGALPEAMGDHLLVGVTKTKITEDIEVDEETGGTKESTVYESKSLIRVFSEQGIFDLQ